MIGSSPAPGRLVPFSPVQLTPPDLLVKAVSDGRRVGLQLHHVPGLNRPLADFGAWWSGSRRMWVLEAQPAEQLAEILRGAYAGQHVDLTDIEVTLRAALAAPDVDHFTQLLDLQVFPLAKAEFCRGRWAVSFTYDPLCSRAMRSLGGYFHKHAAVWQVRAEPHQVMDRLRAMAGIVREYVFVHEQPVVIEDLSASSSSGSPIKVPAAPPPQGGGGVVSGAEEGTGFLSTQREASGYLSYDKAAIRALVETDVLRHYQGVGVAHMVRQTGACMGDDMGLGKSRQTVVATRLAAGAGIALKIGCTSLVGADSLKRRQAAVDDFQGDPSIRVFIGTTTAAGVGITLTAANIVVFASLPWTPALTRQAEDRAYRLGQKRNVLVLIPVVPGTIDEGVLRLQENKRNTEIEVIEATKMALPDMQREQISGVLAEAQKEEAALETI